MERLKELRLAKNMTLKQMAESLGMVQRNYQRYETGEVDPPLSKAIALADFFGVTIDFLVGKSDFPDYSTSEDTISFPLLPVRLKALRKAHGIDLFTVAESVGETERNYAGYENGEVLPRLRTICALADYFDVSLDYLVGRSDTP